MALELIYAPGMFNSDGIEVALYDTESGQLEQISWISPYISEYSNISHAEIESAKSGIEHSRSFDEIVAASKRAGNIWRR